ncbi:latexin isoform X2 [Anabas testudineus]|uniref:latexin isoform X2 n=1 Tax=Anabas testudineus TaxID=64144 RepID=UPI000E464467|nr:latexin isoform X2 [Anabas testudineus]
MDLAIIVVLVGLAGVTGSPTVTIRPEAAPADRPAHTNTVLQMTKKTVFGQETVLIAKEAVEDVMATGELNPSHYPAQRAAKVIQHYLNTRYGSPYRLVFMRKVHSGHAEDVAGPGRKYRLEISVQEFLRNITEKCSAEVLFPRGEKPGSPEVQASCEELRNINIKAQEEALYQQYKRNQSLLSAQYLPDSHGHIDPDMEPFWHLGIVAASFVMLKESTENTLYNVAQVANVTQLESENDQLKFDYIVLLHEMVSQEILHWKLLFTWSPSEGVKVLHMEQLPRCHCEKPPNTN